MNGNYSRSLYRNPLYTTSNDKNTGQSSQSSRRISPTFEIRTDNGLAETMGDKGCATLGPGDGCTELRVARL